LRPPAFRPGNGLWFIDELNGLKWLLSLASHQPDEIGAAYYAETLVKMGWKIAAAFILLVSILRNAKRLRYLSLRQALRLSRGLHALGK